MQKITEMKSEDLFKFVENFVNVKINTALEYDLMGVIEDEFTE